MPQYKNGHDPGKSAMTAVLETLLSVVTRLMKPRPARQRADRRKFSRNLIVDADTLYVVKKQRKK